MNDTGLNGLAILVIEDEVLLRKQIVGFLETSGAGAIGAGTLEEGRKLIQDSQFDFVLIDVNLPDGRGTDLLKQKVLSATSSAVVMTAQGGVAGAVEAMQLGALDYLVKPFDLAELPLVINRARRNKQFERLEEHRRVEKSFPGDEFYFGRSLAPMEAQLKKILAADLRMEQDLPPVLIVGETGTGKTTIARWLHQQGPIASQPLVEVNCSALPETLAESELFGHERGAFTDARTARMGLFEAANGGTLFLDELPSLSLTLQAKLLSTIEDHKVRRLGGNKPIKINVRLIGATNRDLKDLVAAGQFREDLYHRFNEFSINVPALRERKDDIIAMATHFLNVVNKEQGKNVRGFSPKAEQILREYPWPGNVRELKNVIRRAVLITTGEELDASAFPEEMVAMSKEPVGEANLKDAALHAEYEMIKKVLGEVNNNKSKAAKILNIDRKTLYNKLRQFNLDDE